MALFARKIHGCVFVKRSGKYYVSLVELAKGNGDFFSFVLVLKIVSLSAKKRSDMFRMSYLDETDVEKAVECYFTPKGSVRKDFPGIKDDRWKIASPWLVQAVDTDQMASSWMRVRKSLALARPRSGRRFWSGHLRKRKWPLGKQEHS